MTHPLSQTVSAVLSGLEVRAFYPYRQWEAALIERWGLVPDPNVPDLAARYMDSRNYNGRALSCVEALRVFHVNQFKPAPARLVLKFIQDYDNVPGEIVEPEWNNDPETGARLEQYNDQHTPKSGTNLRRKIFDMGRGPQPR